MQILCFKITVSVHMSVNNSSLLQTS